MSVITKNAIMDSLQTLLEEKPFVKITVKDIVENTGINRNTFYYHFDDIYDLLEQLFQREVDNTRISEMNHENREEIFEEIFALCMKYRKGLNHIFESINTQRLCAYIRNVIIDGIHNYLNLNKDMNTLEPQSENFMINMVADSMVGFFVYWGNSRFSPELGRQRIQDINKVMPEILQIVGQRATAKKN